MEMSQIQFIYKYNSVRSRLGLTQISNGVREATCFQKARNSFIITLYSMRYISTMC